MLSEELGNLFSLMSSANPLNVTESLSKKTPEVHLDMRFARLKKLWKFCEAAAWVLGCDLIIRLAILLGDASVSVFHALELLRSRRSSHMTV